MSIKESFSSVDKNENNIISLLPECFLSHHPSRKVIHFSSKQLPSSSMNISFDMTPIPRAKKNTKTQKGIKNNTSDNNSILSKEKEIILKKAFEEIGILRDSVSGRNSNSTVDDIGYISYFNLDDSDFED